uniref:SMODS and SLOG-associating 2TM effector domain-containing protein n=1 Tax=Streptomyces sp. NBC_01401 TaxID=2903854 RepID=A0AAU3H0B8_9ACTN
MGHGEQLVTIAAVLLGALTTHLTTFIMERSRNKYALLTRWDDRKIDAYEGYVDRVRAGIFLAVQLYEHREGIRPSGKPESDLHEELREAARLRGRAFERVMLLGGDSVVEAGHELNTVALAIDWQADGRTIGALDEWRTRHRAAFRQINEFHEAARTDLGVQGSVKGEKHRERDLVLPSSRRDGDTAGSAGASGT